MRLFQPPSAPIPPPTTDAIICPQCNDPVLIEQINCGIFRHAVMKETGQQIDPHSPEAVCLELLKQDRIWGCGKPFQIVKEESGWVVRCCDYL